MTERFTEWMQLLGERDWALTQFAGIALVIVMAWFGLDLYPRAWRRWLRGAFLIVSLVGFVLTLAYSIGG